MSFVIAFIMATYSRRTACVPMDLGPSLPFRTCTLGPMSAEGESVLRTPVPGRLYEIVKLASYIELALFAALLVVWLAPGHGGRDGRSSASPTASALSLWRC